MDRIQNKLLIILIVGFLLTSCRKNKSEQKSTLVTETEVITSNNLSQNVEVKRNSCELLPSVFSSYSDALYQVKNADFEIEDKFRPGYGEWIDQISFFSCDGISGYLIMETKGKEYIHEGFPFSRWNELKNAESPGSYYARLIKGKFRLQPR